MLAANHQVMVHGDLQHPKSSEKVRQINVHSFASHSTIDQACHSWSTRGLCYGLVVPRSLVGAKSCYCDSLCDQLLALSVLWLGS